MFASPQPTAPSQVHVCAGWAVLPVWIDATQAVDDIQEQINDLLANSPEDDAQKRWKIIIVVVMHH